MTALVVVDADADANSDAAGTGAYVDDNAYACYEWVSFDIFVCWVWTSAYESDDGRHAREHAVLDRVRGERVDDLIHAVVRELSVMPLMQKRA